MIKVSIIVPVYNAELYLEQCLNSLLNQTYKDLEIICIDGASNDNSYEILKKYAIRDNRIILKQIKNLGVSISRNEGLQLASGDYLMFVDADDWIDINTCNDVIAILLEEDCDTVFWSYVREFDNKSLPKKIFEKDKIIFKSDDVKQKLHRRCIGLIGKELQHIEAADSLCPVWGKVYKRSIINNNNIKFIDIREIGTYEDRMFNLEYLEHAQKVVYIQEFYYHYRKDNSNSITSKYKPYLFNQWLTLFEIMYNYIKDKKLSIDYINALNNRICISVLGQGLNIMESDKGFIYKYNKLREVIKSPVYRKAYCKFSCSDLTFKWKVFYGCAKNNFIFCVYMLLICIKSMIGR